MVRLVWYTPQALKQQTYQEVTDNIQPLLCTVYSLYVKCIDTYVDNCTHISMEVMELVTM